MKSLRLILLFLIAGTVPVAALDLPADTPLWSGAYYNDAVPSTGADKLHALGITGKGLTTAILDSGFDLGNDVFKNTAVVNDYTYSGSDGEHGTFVAGTVISMAPDSNLWLQAYSGDEDAPVAEVFRKIAENAARYDIAALNLSWGDNFEGLYGSPADVEAAYPLTEEAVRALLAAGVRVVGATGNSSVNGRMSFPDGLPGILSVGSMSPYGCTASHGTLYDKPGMFLLAPGDNIYAAYADIPFEDVLLDGSRTAYGTSVAAPHVTGAITLLKSGARAASTEEIVAALYDSAARVVYDPDERIDGWHVPDGISPGTGYYFVLELERFEGIDDSADRDLYYDWLNEMTEKHDANNVTAGEWRILSRIANMAFIVSQNYNDEATAVTASDGESLYGFALFKKLMEMTDVFTPLPPTEFGFLQVDAAYRLLTARRAEKMASAAALSGSSHAASLDAFSREMGAYLDQNLVDLFQRLDGQPADILVRATRQLGPGRIADTLHSSIFGMLGLHGAAGRRLFAFRDRVLFRAEEKEEEQPVAAEDALASLNLTLPSMTSVWGEGFGGYHDRDETINSGGYHGSFAGLMVGMEKNFGEALAGGFAAWANHNIHGDGASRGNWGTFGFYGGLIRDRFSAGLSVAAGMGDYSLTRQVDGPAISLIGMDYAAMRIGANGDSTAASFSARASADWTLTDRNGWKFDVGAEAAFAHAFMSGYTERDGGGINLTVRRHGESYAEGGAGLRASKTFFRRDSDKPFLTASVKVSTLYGGAFGSDMTATFTGAGSSFAVEPERIKSAWFVPEASLSWKATERVTVSATYQARFGRHSSTNTGSLSVGLDW